MWVTWLGDDYDDRCGPGAGESPAVGSANPVGHLLGAANHDQVRTSSGCDADEFFGAIPEAGHEFEGDDQTR